MTIIKFASDTGSSNYLLPPTELILSAIIRMQIIPAGIQKKCKLSVKSAPPLSTGYRWSVPRGKLSRPQGELETHFISKAVNVFERHKYSLKFMILMVTKNWRHLCEALHWTSLVTPVAACERAGVGGWITIVWLMFCDNIEILPTLSPWLSGS